MMEMGMEATMTAPIATAHDPMGKAQKVSRGTPTRSSGIARASWEPTRQHPPSSPAPHRKGIAGPMSPGISRGVVVEVTEKPM
jgi:hypothetical protein